MTVPDRIPNGRHQAPALARLLRTARWLVGKVSAQ